MGPWRSPYFGNSQLLRSVKILPWAKLQVAHYLNVTTSTQKVLGIMLKVKPLKSYEKHIRYEVAAVHATPSICSLPKILPTLMLWFHFDELYVSDEPNKHTYENMDNITSNYRSKTIELYARTTKI
ncbi:hypothetical protein I4U23_005201 [Adineta vaga]|nr:hypothetical protein I4U23_005201 [Adineta vaga]